MKTGRIVPFFVVFTLLALAAPVVAPTTFYENQFNADPCSGPITGVVKAFGVDFSEYSDGLAAGECSWRTDEDTTSGDLAWIDFPLDDDFDYVVTARTGRGGSPAEHRFAFYFLGPGNVVLETHRSDPLEPAGTSQIVVFTVTAPTGTVEGRIAHYSGGGGGYDQRTDYVTVTSDPSNDFGTIIVVKNAIPDHAQDFNFVSTIPGCASFTLDDDADPEHSNQVTCSLLTPGTYSIWEGRVHPRTTTQWNVASSCSDGSTTEAVAVSGGETVTCTFNNTISLPLDFFGSEGAIYAGNKTTFAEAFRVPTGALDFGLGLVFLLGFAGTGFGFAGPMGAVGGAVLGAVLSVAIGFFPVWGFVLVLAAGILFFVLMARGSSA